MGCPSSGGLYAAASFPLLNFLPSTLEAAELETKLVSELLQAFEVTYSLLKMYKWGKNGTEKKPATVYKK